MDMITLAKIFEVAMLVLFGISWPFNLVKSIRSKSTKGKSLIFLILVDVGYIPFDNNKVLDWDNAGYSEFKKNRFIYF